MTTVAAIELAQSKMPPMEVNTFEIHCQSPVVLPSVNTPVAVAVGALI